MLGVEAAAIFLSVLLGFGVAGWRDGRAEADRRATLLGTFAQEVEANRENLIERGTYHHWLARQMDAGVEEGSIVVLSDIFRVENVTGFNPLALSGTAWQTATATGELSLLDYDTASPLWQLYDAQRLMDAEQERMRAIALDAFTSTDPGPVARFQVLMRGFAGLEREYLSHSNDALRQIAEVRGAEPPVQVEVFERDPFAEADSSAAVAPPVERE